MRALAVQGQEPTVLQAHQVEVTLAKRSYGTRFEALNRAGNLNSRFVLQRLLAPAWPQERCGYPACFEHGQATE
jgi:hypothetical protein